MTNNSNSNYNTVGNKRMNLAVSNDANVPVSNKNVSDYINNHYNVSSHQPTLATSTAAKTSINMNINNNSNNITNLETKKHNRNNEAINLDQHAKELKIETQLITQQTDNTGKNNNSMVSTNVDVIHSNDHPDYTHTSTVTPTTHDQTLTSNNTTLPNALTLPTTLGSYTTDPSNTVISHVSSALPPFIVNNALIVIIGIGKYDSGLPDLDGVIKDYDNIIAAFVKTWKYHVLYQVCNNKSDVDDVNSGTVYTNKMDKINSNRNYKLYWTEKDITSFVEHARQTVIKNKHDGLVFVVSSHGEEDNQIIDSNLGSYELQDIFALFSPDGKTYLETYKETDKESQYLFNIPKIFCIDCCRGQAKAKATVLNQDSISVGTNNDNDEKHTVINNQLPVQKEKAEINVVKENVSQQGQKYNYSSNNFSQSEEKFVFKTISKEESSMYGAQLSNFCKLWANVNGFAVSGGNKHGGIFLRNVCKVFKDEKFILSNTWDNIVLKISQYTKTSGTMVNNLINITQIVEYESTLEKSIRFVRYGVKKPIDSSSIHNQANKITIYNPTYKNTHTDIV